MSGFTEKESVYLDSQQLGRLATVDAKGNPHVVPVGFRYNPDLGTIDIGGYNMTASKKYRDAVRHGRVAFVVDDVQPSGLPRMLEVRGTVEGVDEIIRIKPTYIVSFGVEEDYASIDQIRPHARSVA